MPSRASTLGRVTGLSLWWDQLAADRPQEAEPRPPLDGDTTADVVIVGGGLTGLWTAYYLQEADPGLDVVVVEQEVAGFGASGRSGGWCSAQFPVSAAALARRHGHDAAVEMRAAMRDAVVEVGGVAAAEHLACGFAYGGTVLLARDEAQLERLADEAAQAATWGDELELLDPAGVADHLRAEGVLGGAFTPDCARLQPAALVRGLADLVVSRGARLSEHTRAVRLSPRAVVTEHGTVRARWVVRATEAWTATLPGSDRELAPVHSLMIATQPLPAAIWELIGLDRAESFGGAGHLPVHGGRSADGRLVLGGRGAPYRAGSTIDPASDQLRAGHEHLRRTLVRLFPAVADTTITHRWAGPLGVPRDGHASVGLDPDTGIGWAGGYGDDGVAAANLAGRTLADLITEADSPLVRLPWVGHRSPRWAPEPLRWAQVSAARWAMRVADETERRTRRPNRRTAATGRLPGR